MAERWPLPFPHHPPRATSDMSLPWTTEVLGTTLRVVGADGGDIALFGHCAVPANWTNARLLIAAAASREGE